MILDIYCKKKNPNTVVVANLFLNFQIVFWKLSVGLVQFKIQNYKRKEEVSILSLSFPMISDN